MYILTKFCGIKGKLNLRICLLSIFMTKRHICWMEEFPTKKTWKVFTHLWSLHHANVSCDHDECCQLAIKNVDDQKV